MPLRNIDATCLSARVIQGGSCHHYHHYESQATPGGPQALQPLATASVEKGVADGPSPSCAHYNPGLYNPPTRVAPRKQHIGGNGGWRPTLRRQVGLEPLPHLVCPPEARPFLGRPPVLLPHWPPVATYTWKMGLESPFEEALLDGQVRLEPSPHLCPLKSQATFGGGHQSSCPIGPQ